MDIKLEVYLVREDGVTFHLSKYNLVLFEFTVWKKGVYGNRRNSAVFVTPNNFTNLGKHTVGWNSSVCKVSDFLYSLVDTREFNSYALKLGWSLYE